MRKTVTIHWEAVKQDLPVVLFVLQFYKIDQFSHLDLSEGANLT